MKPLGQNTQNTDKEIQIQHAPGRSCPLTYRYESSVFKTSPFTRLTEGPNYNQEQVVRFDLAINKTR
jgi:hypothetical protein